VSSSLVGPLRLSRPCLLAVQSAVHFGFGKVGKLAELGHRHVGPRRLVQLLADALEQRLGGAVLGAGQLGYLFRVDANLGHSGVYLARSGRRIYNR
jgi:hypothetical protein